MMNRFIRWPGLIAFVVIMAVIVGGALLFANPLIKSGIERAGTAMVGARVDVGSVELSLSPAGLVIRDMDVTDADQPMQNAVSVERISFQFDLLKAFMGQLVIDEMDVSGMRFATPRQTSGAIERKPKPVKEKPQEPSFVSRQLQGLAGELPDSRELLAREPLLVDERKKNLDQDYSARKAAWEQMQQQLPDQGKIDEYERRLKAITDSNINSVAEFQEKKQALEQLQKDIRTDRNLMRESRDYLRESQSELGTQLDGLRRAPGEDRDRITEKYSFDQGGLANMSGLLFGEQIQYYLEQALYWYARAEPYISSDDAEGKPARPERDRGRFILFEEEDPTPVFLIRLANVSAHLPAGRVSATLRDVTHQQQVINRPTTLHVSSEVLNNVRELDVQAVFDYRGINNHSTAEFTVREMTVSDLRISGGNDFPLVMEKARADFNGQLRLAERRLSGHMHGDFSEVDFVSGGSSSIAREMGAAFAGIDRFDLDAGLAGSLRRPDISIRSDIDQQLQRALRDRLEARKQQLRHDLDQQLNARLERYLEQYDLESLEQAEQQLNEKIASMDAMLREQLTDFEEQQKQELRDRSRNEIRRLRDRL